MNINTIARNGLFDHDLIVRLRINNNYQILTHFLFITFDGVKRDDIRYKLQDTKTQMTYGNVADTYLPFVITSGEATYPKQFFIHGRNGLSVASIIVNLEKLRDSGFDLQDVNLVIDMYQITEWYDENKEYFHAILNKHFPNIQNAYLLI